MAAVNEAAARRAEPQGDRGRVAVVQRQARASLALGLVFAGGAVVAAGLPHRSGWWLPLHLFLVGGVLSAISGATQLFAVTWAAGPPPGNLVVSVQRGLIAGGALVLALGRELGAPDALSAVGGGAVVAGLVALALILAGIVGPAVQRRFDAALRFYLTALVFGTVGCGLGLALLLGRTGIEPDRLKAAHVALNLLGLVGLVIVGTLPFFSATEARTKMSPRATDRAQGMLLAFFIVAMAAATAGLLGGLAWLSTVGLGAYAAGLGLVGVILPRIRSKQLSWAGPRLVQLGAGILWWGAGVVVAAWRASGDRPPFDRTALSMIVVGGFAQILMASLAYLGPVLRGGGHERLTAGFAATRSWTGLVTANVVALCLAAGLMPLAATAMAVWLADAAWRTMRVAAPGRGSPLLSRARRRPGTAGH